MASPARKCTSRAQPVEQNPHTVLVAASACKRAGVLASPKAAGRSANSRVSGPSQSRSKDFVAFMNQRSRAFWKRPLPEKTVLAQSIPRPGIVKAQSWPWPVVRTEAANSTKEARRHQPTRKPVATATARRDESRSEERRVGKECRTQWEP